MGLMPVCRRAFSRKSDRESIKQMTEEDIGEKLMSMVEGSDFEKRLDKMLADKQAQGLSEEQIMQQMMGSTFAGVDPNSDQKIEFDPLKFNLDKGLMAEFEKLMALKENDAEVQAMLKDLAGS